MITVWECELRDGPQEVLADLVRLLRFSAASQVDREFLKLPEEHY